MRRALVGLVVLGSTVLPIRAAAQYGPRRWTAPDIALAGAFTAALWIDVAQTRQGIARGNYSELNPFLPSNPSIGQVQTYAVLVNLSVLSAAAVVSHPWRTVLLGVATALEVITIHDNARVGLHIRF